ncbi:MAG TPA: phosphate signaling complex protein PhoU [Terrimicrobiaceae bacterium]
MSTDTITMPNTHILSNFEEALRSLRNDALMMASLTERNLENTRKGLFDRDEDWCNTVIADDEEVDTLEVQLDREGVSIMLRFHPLASDMRNVISTMKLSVNLERIADQAVNIARRSRKLIARPAVDDLIELEPIFHYAETMVKDAVRSFADVDLELARGLKERDRRLDEMNRTFADKMTELMTRNVDHIPSYMDLIFISRFLERIGDQATNIGEDTVYAISAEETRHIHHVDG